MNKLLPKIQKQVSFLFLFFFTTTSFAQEFIVTLGNAVMTTQELEVDLLLTVPAPGVRLYSVSTGINFNADILNGGTPSTTSSNTGYAS